MRSPFRLLFVLVPLLLSACGDAREPRPLPEGPADQETAAAGAEAVAFGEALAQIRGHHLVSLELYQVGDRAGAAVHASHPVEEILAAVTGELEEHDPQVAEELATALRAGAGVISEGRPASAVAAAYGEAAALTEEALGAVVGPQATSSSYRGSVIAALLATAGHEYEEAVGDEGIRLPAEYQDGYAFVREAERLYEAVAPEVEEASAEEAAEIAEAFEALGSALPSPRPPDRPAPALDVTSAAELIGHELEETVGAAPAEESDPEAVVAEIEELLQEIVETYRAGDAEAAAELSAEAYLEHYEVIEAEVIEQAPEVNEELEPLLGADLRRRITAGAPAAEIEQMVRRAEELLDEALEALAEH